VSAFWALWIPMLCLWSTKCTHACLFFSILWKNPRWIPDCQRLEQLGLWSTSQLSLWSGVFTWRPELSFRCLLSKVISFTTSMLYNKHCLLILSLFVAICEVWLPGLTYGVYMVLFLFACRTANIYGTKWSNCQIDVYFLLLGAKIFHVSIRVVINGQA
jgi:hypothetical protein